MARHLDALFIEGFKSIRSLPPAEAAGSAREFALKNVNLLIGANGAGKSNFVLFFRMLRAMAEYFSWDVAAKAYEYLYQQAHIAHQQHVS